MKTLLSLFDYSGQWAEPFARGGWDAIQWDIKIEDFMDINLLTDCDTVLNLFENVDGILAAPPCTDFTVSGAQYWPAKDKDGRTAQSIEFIRQVQRLADLFKPTDPDYYEDPENVFFWALENPVGRIQKLFPELGKPYYFQPHEFAGWLSPTPGELKKLDRIRAKNGLDVTTSEADFVKERGAYTKRTGLWGEFNRGLIKKNIAPVKCAPQGSFTQRYGGKSIKTKEARSDTPGRLCTSLL